MHPSTFINVLFLSTLNIFFLVAGIFLNSVVIISLWRSSQLRKKSSYFMILVLSCFDLAGIATSHPILILSTILWSMQTSPEEIKVVWEYTSILLGGFSLFTLLTLSIDRFLGVTYPIFHRTSVTKKRLLFFLALLIIMLVFMSPLLYFYSRTFGNMLIAVTFLSLLLVFIPLNYKIVKIAGAKRKEKSVAPSTDNEARTVCKLNNKKISTCSLAVGCFFFCSSPQIIYSVWRFTSDTPSHHTQTRLLNLWSHTFFSMNSTFNCLIFFWRNSILRREGMKLVKCFSTTSP